MDEALFFLFSVVRPWTNSGFCYFHVFVHGRTTVFSCFWLFVRGRTTISIISSKFIQMLLLDLHGHD